MKHNHSVIIEDEEYSGLTKETAQKIIAHFFPNGQFAGVQDARFGEIIGTARDLGKANGHGTVFAKIVGTAILFLPSGVEGTVVAQEVALEDASAPVTYATAELTARVMALEVTVAPVRASTVSPTAASPEVFRN